MSSFMCVKFYCKMKLTNLLLGGGRWVDAKKFILE